MSNRICILQLGQEDWSKKYNLPQEIDLHYMENCVQSSVRLYDMVFLDREITRKEAAVLQKVTRAYTLFVTQGIALVGPLGELYASKKGKRLSKEAVYEFLLNEAKNYFPNDYGEKFRFNALGIGQGFTGKVRWDGNYSVTLEGDFGETLGQIVYWKNNIPVFSDQAIELWLEYEKDDGIELSLSVTQFYQGSLSEVQQKWEFSGVELEEMVILDNQMKDGPIFVSLQAKGKGKLKIIALHDRYCRRGHGYFLPGGDRYVASNREEIFCYFDPGDRKPPLNVYFSGYKTKQGFEGYYMMRKLGCPFLLIAETRLEGGSFYMGTREYEQLIKEVIEKYMSELGFFPNEVIFAGLSMGTYGALYYGCDIVPHALILGKPLLSIGDVAYNERLDRPGGFPTSLDVLQYVTGDTDEEARDKLNERFWDKFDAVNWSRTKFILSYMIEDDYDKTAYGRMLSHLWSTGVQVYGKGIHGRHNDETASIVSWFSSQFQKVLREDFGRRVE